VDCDWDVEGCSPGELDLKERLRVGRDTLRLALQLLVKEGWLEPSSQGRKRRVYVQELSELKQLTRPDFQLPFYLRTHLSKGKL